MSEPLAVPEDNERKLVSHIQRAGELWTVRGFAEELRVMDGAARRQMAACDARAHEAVTRAERSAAAFDAVLCRS